MNIEKYTELVLKNSNPPKKNDKWFRLSKFLEEYGEFKTAATFEESILELEDCFHTLALMSQFAEEVEEAYMIRHDLDLLTWGLQVHNKRNDDEYNRFYYHMKKKLCKYDRYEKVLKSSYERLVG